MTEEAKQVVEFLNKKPFDRSLSFISYQSLGQEQILQLLNDVLAEIDPTQGGDIREEPSDVRAPRMLSCLKNLKYVPPSNVDVSTFRQGIVLGEKSVVQPILFYLLKNLEPLKTRAYLAKYLVKLPIPAELLHDGSDSQLQDLWSKCTELQEQFSAMHKDLVELRKSSRSTNEIKNDIKTMEDEKENLQKKVDRTRKKVEGSADFNEALQVAQNMRKEKGKGEIVQEKLQQQRRIMQNTEQRLQRIRQQVYDMQQSSNDTSPESLISRMEEDNQLNNYLVNEKLPKELEAKRKQVRNLRKVASGGVLNERDLERLEEKISSCNADINKLVEKKMMSGNPEKDKMNFVRQQARILSHKKEQLAEEVQQKKEEAVSLKKELQEKRIELKEMGGGVLKGDEYKDYVQILRGKSSMYKKNRSILAELRSEVGILTRTEAILQKQNDSMNRKVSALGSRKGVTGFRETQDELEKVSALKSEVDETKHRTLDDMSEMVDQLNTKINDKKSLLAPIIKQLRPLRQQHQELTAEFEDKKTQYDGTAAGLESNRAQLEQTVTALREECFQGESRYHYYQSMCKILQTKIDRAVQEQKYYATGDKRQSYRERFNKKIQEQENLTRILREKQKDVKQNHESEAEQANMWRDLEKIMKCKLSILRKQKDEINQINQVNSQTKNPLTRDATQDRLVL